MQQVGVFQTGRDHRSLFGCVADLSGPGQEAAPPTEEPLTCKEAKRKCLVSALPGDKDRSAPQKWSGFARKLNSWVVGRGCQEARPNVSESL